MTENKEPWEERYERQAQKAVEKSERREGKKKQPKPAIPEFTPSYRGSHHEERWIRQSLGGFFDDGWITDVLYQVSGGKEATVYCCEAHPSTGLELIAAKIYRPRMFRAMRNDCIYKEGRPLFRGDGKAARDRRSRLALKKRTKYGRAIDASSWVAHEYQTMVLFHQAGADVARPLVQGENAILMEYVGDAGFGAPTLKEIRLPSEEAPVLFEKLMRNVELFLECNRIHGDLSAYNVLYWNGKVKIIDFPQAVHASTNPSALFLLHRDVERLCRYFSRHGVSSNAWRITEELWAGIG
jgi:RIO kinase 1